jgi:hypothetical protein
MNKELINSLYEQAALNALNDQSVPLTSESINHHFAELIIDDCVQSIIDNTPALNPEFDTVWDLGYDRAMKDCVHHIKENFGVEE